MLVARNRNAFTGLQLVQTFTRQFAVAFEFTHRVIDVAIRGLISQAVVLQFANHIEHFGDVFGRTRFVRWALDAKCIGVFVHCIDEAIGQFAQ